MSVKTDKDEERDSGSGVPVVETNRFGFILGNGETDSDAPSPELVRHRELKWLGLIKQWDQVMEKKNNKVKGQCQKGIPTSVRAKCWPLLCGALDRMKQNKELYKHLVEAPDQHGWTEIIKRDTDRQFPFHEMFLSKDGHGQQNLLQVLKAYTQYRPEEGYCQGQGPVAAVLLMNMPAEEAFWCLAQISEHYLPGYYSPLLEGVLFDAAVLSSVLKKMCPAAHKHLQNQGVEPLMFATDWLMCLYSRHLPFNTLLRVWDLFFCYGVRVLFQVAVVLVRRCLGEGRQRKECDGQIETLERLRGVKQHVQNYQTDTFIHEVCSVPLSLADLQKQVDKEMEKWKIERPDSTFDPRGRCHGYRMACERAQNKQKDNEKKDKVKGTLTLPLMRSHSSLSPSVLRKKWRKRGSKTNTEEWDGGGRNFSQSMLEGSDEGEMRRKSVCGVVGEQRAKQDRLADELHIYKQKDQGKNANISPVVTSNIESDVFEEEHEVCVSQMQNVMETDSRHEDILHTQTDDSKKEKCDVEKITESLESKETHEHEPKLERKSSEDKLITEKETCTDEVIMERETCQEKETCQEEPTSENETCQGEPILEGEACIKETIAVQKLSEEEPISEIERCENEPISREGTCEDKPITEQEKCKDEPMYEKETCENEQESERKACGDKPIFERESDSQTDEQSIENQEHQNEHIAEFQITSTTSELSEENIPAPETSHVNYDPQEDIQINCKQEEEKQLDRNYQKDEVQKGSCKPKGPLTNNQALQIVLIPQNTGDETTQNKENTLETGQQTHTQDDSMSYTSRDGLEERIHSERQADKAIGENLTDAEKARIQHVVSYVQIPEEREITEHSHRTTDDNTGSEEDGQEISPDERDCDSHKSSNELQTCKAVLTSSSMETDSEPHPDESVTVQGLDHHVQQFQPSDPEFNDSELEPKEEDTLGTSRRVDIPNSQLEDTSVASMKYEYGDIGTVATNSCELNSENSEENKTAVSENTTSQEVISTKNKSNPESKGEAVACIPVNPESNEIVQIKSGNLGDKEQFNDGFDNQDSKEVDVTAQSSSQESNNENVTAVLNHPEDSIDGSGNPKCEDSTRSGNHRDSQELGSSVTPNIPPAQLCLRRTSSAHTSYPTILSEDTFREPKQMSTDHTQTNTPMTDMSSPLMSPAEINSTSKPETAQVTETKSDLQTKVNPPKRLGLFRRLRGDTNKTPVPKILIQDFSEKEDKLTSKERRRRKREKERKEKEDKERKKREKEMEKDRERERKKPQTRGKSFQVHNRKCAGNDMSLGSSDSQMGHSRRNSAPFSDSYF